MDFQIDRDYISTHTSPEFYRGDVIVKDHEQLKYLSTAKTLFIDGTFKMVCKPFVQLLSIHFFAKHEDNMKQLPGVFVLMSRKRNKERLQEGTSTDSETASIATSSRKVSCRL